jgi:DMSO/TMAO reductase YedYZ heme-binding membrane subunit
MNESINIIAPAVPAPTTPRPPQPAPTPLTRAKDFTNRLIFKGIIPFRKFLQRILLGLAAITPLIWYIPDPWKDLGWGAWYLLFFIMLIRPLADIFPNIRLFRALVFFRKETGILCASLVLAHGVGFYLANNLPVISSFFDFTYWTFDNNAGYAHIGGLLAVILLITSNKWSQVILKRNWKRVQRLAYAFFLVGGLHIALIGDETVSIFLQMGTVIVLWLLAHFRFSVKIITAR